MDTKRIFIAEYHIADKEEKNTSHILAKSINEALSILIREKESPNTIIHITAVNDTDRYCYTTNDLLIRQTILSKSVDAQLKLWYAHFKTKKHRSSNEDHFIYFVADDNNSLFKLISTYLRKFGNYLILQSLDYEDRFLDGQELHEVNLSDVIN